MGKEKTVSEAFLLAAGLGTRMRPITDNMPKPLVEVAGKAMLDHALDALALANVEHTVINVHYLADQIERHVEKRVSPRITISDEREELLDSGGGVKKGLSCFNSSTVFILNADSFWKDQNQSNLMAIQSAWQPEHMDMLMLLADCNNAVGFHGAGDFFRDEEGRLTRRGQHSAAPFAYAGALITKTSLFDGVAESVFSLNRLFDDALSRGRLFGHVLQGLWLHVGTPDAISQAETALEKEQAA